MDERWQPYPNQWRVLKSTRKLNEEEIDQWIKEWDQEDVLGLFSDIKECEDDKPWKKRTIEFNASDVDKLLHLVRAERLYVETTHIKPGMANQIRRLASLRIKSFLRPRPWAVLQKIFPVSLRATIIMSSILPYRADWKKT